VRNLDSSLHPDDGIDPANVTGDVEVRKKVSLQMQAARNRIDPCAGKQIDETALCLKGSIFQQEGSDKLFQVRGRG
jgi:hypothetical protein